MNIYESLSAVMADCKAVGKGEKNTMQGYKYRGIDAVMNAVNPALTKNKVFVAPEVLETTREERINAKGTLLIYSVARVKYKFYAEDGTSVEATVVGEGMDSGDKSMNKAMSAAFKYALFQVLCIPTEEMIDSEKDSPEPLPKINEEDSVIEEKHVRALLTRCTNEGVDVKKLCAKYNVKTLNELMFSQLTDICSKWTKEIKKECLCEEQ